MIPFLKRFWLGYKKLRRPLADLRAQLVESEHLIGALAVAHKQVAVSLDDTAGVQRDERQLEGMDAKRAGDDCAGVHLDRGRLRAGASDLLAEMRRAVAELDRLNREITLAHTDAENARARRQAMEAQAETAAALAMQAAAHLREVDGRLAAARSEEADIHHRVQDLKREHEELLAQGPPLGPYVPPEQVPSRASSDHPLGTRVPYMDLMALNRHSRRTGVDIKAAVTQALRLFLPRWAYEEALSQIQREVESQAKMVLTRDAMPVGLPPTVRAG